MNLGDSHAPLNMATNSVLRVELVIAIDRHRLEPGQTRQTL